MGQLRYGGRMSVEHHNDPLCEMCISHGVVCIVGATEQCFPCFSLHLKCKFSKYKAPAAPVTLCKAPCKTKKDYPNAGHTIADKAGKSELEVVDVPPPKRKKRALRPVVNLSSYAKPPTKPEDVSCAEAGPSQVRDYDGELVRLHTENAGLQESQVHQCTFMLNACHHMHVQQVELLSMSNKFYT
ncbi:hypothetical protein CY34DRAFT_16928 [Suillus luteus UH-Slu-Lm8-n1]|uniref:Uncharacterized protein n=1 Tax=Suillus luteus UH-Slu-Lm8-n1 TaxID=930992 RepID=A0A0D0AMY9_9AGAM|nr:hypothetical protein CY34DRAFT_16928 [Suillus luteus UH-Slu-Lm8-n1]